jgi:photosystem II stability/assembly factor-like uncharacterized protein
VGQVIALMVAVAVAAAAATPPAPATPAANQTVWTPQASGPAVELRGIAVRDGLNAWATGADGTVLRTVDGKTWQKITVPGGVKLDFRDVEVLSDGAVILMSAGPGDLSRIYRSTDGGKSWKLVHTNPDKDGFYDSIAFWDDKSGVVLGDPVNRRFVTRLTSDGGLTWAAPPPGSMSEAFPGEGAFAASGTCLTVLKGGKEGWFVTGGARISRVFRTFDRGRSWSSATNPVPAGNASSGLFSVAFVDGKVGFAAGGNYKDPTLAALNGSRTENGGRNWIPAPVSESGFFSAVVAVPGAKSRLIAVGPIGTAVSDDRGMTWRKVDATPLNAVAFSDEKTGWAIGPKGTIVRYRSGS